MKTEVENDESRPYIYVELNSPFLRELKEEIFLIARKKGYKTTSAYIRGLLLEARDEYYNSYKSKGNQRVSAMSFDLPFAQSMNSTLGDKQLGTILVRAFRKKVAQATPPDDLLRKPRLVRKPRMADRSKTKSAKAK